MIGTLINVGAIIAGSIVGILAHSKLPERYTKICFIAIGLFTLFIGFSLAQKTNNYLIMVFSLVLGAIIGEMLDIDGRLKKLGEVLKKKVKSNNAKFAEGFITAFLLYCMGSMTILGAIEEGLGGEPNLLLAKSLMDGISSIALAAALGIGVIFSIVPLLIYQGGLTLLAMYLGDYFSPDIINELTGVGGILLIGLGIDILEIKKIKILNLVPSIVIVVILSYFFI